MDVLMPDGTTIIGVPEGITKAQLLAKYQGAQSQPGPNEPQVPGLSEGMSALSQVPRQLGLTVRAGLGGLGGIANTVLDPAVAGINAATGTNLPLPSQAMERTLSRFLPTPDTPMERIAQAGARSLVPVGVGAQAGKTVASLAPLSQSLLPQALSAIGGSTASQGAAEAGAGPWGQMGAGLLGGVAGPTALAAANAAARAALRVPGSLLSPFTKSGQLDAAAKIFQGAASNPADAAASLGAAPQLTPKQQAYRASLGYSPPTPKQTNFELVPGSKPLTAEVANDPGLSSFYKTLRNENPALFASIDTSNDAARRAFLAETFGNETDLNTAMATRESATAPLRDQSLSAANAGGVQNAALDAQIAALRAQETQKAQSKVQALQNAGQLQTAGAQQEGFANNFVPVPGMPRVPASLSGNIGLVPDYAQGAQEFLRLAAQREAERQALASAVDKLANSGYAPSLQSRPLLDSIQSTLNAPGLRASDVVSKTLSDIQGKIAKYTDANGVIDARDLYTIRKELGNTIKGFAKESNNWDKRLTAGLQDGIQGQIDRAIVGAGGSNWPQYLGQYADHSRGINGMQLGQEITKAATSPQTERLLPGTFARQVANNASEIAQAGARYSDALTRVNEDLKRSVAPLNAMRTVGSDTVQNSIAQQAAQRIAGHAPIIGKALSGLYGIPERQVRKLVLSGAIDPNMGGGLLARKIPMKPDLVSGLLGLRFPISYGGLLGSVSAQQGLSQ